MNMLTVPLPLLSLTPPTCARAPLSQTGKAQDDPGLGGRGARGSSELSDGPKFANAYGWWQSLWAEASAHARARRTARAPHRARARC